MDPIATDDWGVLNVLCLMLPTLAPADNVFVVVRPQTKTSIYHSSVAIRTAVSSIVSKQADWSTAISLIADENRVVPLRS